MSFKMSNLLLGGLCAALSAATHAEDIDLFVSPAVAAADAPNVLILLDNTANWNTAFTNEKAALVDTFNSLPLDKFNVGIMMFGVPQLGYVRAAVRPMNATNRPLYSDLVNSLDRNGDKASARTLSRTISEAYRYLTGSVSVDTSNLGSNGERDYSGNTSGNTQTQAVHALADNALASSSATSYTSPINPAACDGRTFIIYIGNNVSSGNVTKDNNSRNSAAGSELAAAGGDTTQIALAYSAHQDNYADEWARFMKADLGATFYTVDVDPTPMPGGHSNGMGNSALLESMANVSNGKYFRVDSSVGGGIEISNALKSIFSEIQSVNSVFASVSLPVSVNTQGTYLNQVYVGMFRPDERSLPRWAGNLKQYRLAQVGDDLKLVDSYEPSSAADPYRSAINTTTGFINECATSYWTPSILDSYWSFKGFEQHCLAVANSADSNTPDGNMVEKGGQGYVLRDRTARRVLTCNTNFATCATTASLTNFDTSNANITSAVLNATSTTERSELIQWARGLDVDDENSNGISATSPGEMRPSAHGDIVHSRPVAINYGTQASPEVVVFYGGNDGALRAINGNRAASNGAVLAGEEYWSFIPPEFFGNIKRIRLNDGSVDAPYISYPGTIRANVAAKPYGMDGSVTAFWNDANGDGDLQDPSDEAYLYATMRRGGRVLYAFDVSTPSSPSLKWKKGCPNNFTSAGVVSDVGCTSGFSDIGQTWSAPTQFYSAGYGSGSSPLLIMGGGYDTCEDVDTGTANNSCGINPKGSQIYVLDADTGARLKTLDTDRSVVGDIIVAKDGSDLGIYAYASDTGGNVYRITMGSSAPSAWTITKIAALGCDVGTSCNPNRKFIYAPDVVYNPATDIYYLTLGSGDREKPLETYTATTSVDNYFFMLQDKPSEATWLTSEVMNCVGASNLCLNSLLGITTSADPSATDLATKKGWYLGLDSQEQVVTSAITVFNTVTFSTHQPASAGAACASLGDTRVYNIRYDNAASANGTASRFEDLVGDGLPPSPVAGMVTLDDGKTVPFIIGATPGSPLEASLPPSPSEANRPTSRVFWNIEE